MACFSADKYAKVIKHIRKNSQDGLEVEGVDISPGAVKGGLERARNSGVNLMASVGNLEGDYHIMIG
jgi:ubiquinone/menaquinone biosynthesis C-methylase UbiE